MLIGSYTLPATDTNQSNHPNDSILRSMSFLIREDISFKQITYWKYNNNYMNITFDIETLGTNMNAPITQIGAVKFKDNGEICEEFLATIDLQSLDEYDFKLDYTTLDWWFRQDPQAVESVYRLDKGNTESLSNALIRFKNWIGDPSEYFYWSHANFDAPILENAYQKVGIKPPFLRRRQRDIRTLCHFTGEVHIERYGIYHNALDDAITQARYISLRLCMLPKPGNQEGSILKPHTDEV